MSRLSGRLSRAALAALLATLAMPAVAAISVDKTEVIVQASAEREAITVTNESDAPAFVSITAREILEPGKVPEVANRSPDPKLLGLLAAPTRLALAPKERRTLRLQFLDPARARDRVWRVTVQEVSGPVASETTGLVLLIGYDVLVIQRPEKPAPSLSARRDGKKLEVTNGGNSFALLDYGQQCPSNDAAACKDIVGARIYPGQSRSFELVDERAPVVFKLKTPEGEEEVRY
jgi:P pilus assembly chaperone PapD